MEKDTILLSVEKYNELRDFKNETEKNLNEQKCVVIEENYGFGYKRKRSFYTQNEITLSFEKRIKELETENLELSAKIEKLECTEPKEKTIEDIKNMSYWEFIKWKKS